ncbi:hypothetical protein [Tardiphaga sp.]|nr:hypothetical protein [Tardiphaga sp.]MDB5615900.1 hypothetical protein [Tardiphaga sp.]
MAAGPIPVAVLTREQLGTAFAIGIGAVQLWKAFGEFFTVKVK